MDTKTQNGMPAYSSTLNACLDLFYSIGASRGKDVLPAFKTAIKENEDLAVRIALWARDVREGSGERQLFRDILKYVASANETIAIRIAQKIPELGRFDDLLTFFGTPVEDVAASIIIAALDNKNSLCAKWMPRKGVNANILRTYMQLTPKQYRKLIVGLSNTVEQKMCAGKWTEIDFSKVPSLASARYQKTFSRRAGEHYAKYIEALQKGEATINASAVYPYDIIKSYKFGDSDVASEQWKALPNYMEGSTDRIIPVVDVSGSMTCPAGRNTSVTCMDVAVSLGLYISERTAGPFKDQFITFSSNPKIQKVQGNLGNRIRSMETAEWGMSTDLEKVFKLVLSSAKLYSVPESLMPTKILILSDMQFNACVTNDSQSALDMIEKQYEQAGYKMPTVIFWNINACGNVPTTFSKSGVALVSGFSPSIMKTILACKNVDPKEVMLHTIGNDRYSW
jgi:hypothetical protein